MATFPRQALPLRWPEGRRPQQEIRPLSELLPDGADDVRSPVAPPPTLLSEVERAQGPARPDLSAYDGGPSLLNAPYEPPAGEGMPIGADLGAYGGGKDSGILKRLAPVLEFIGKLGMGAQAGASEPGFLSGMGGGYRDAITPKEPLSSPADMLKAEAGLISAKADAAYKELQGLKVEEETSLMSPQHGLAESEAESRNLLREAQAEYQQAFAGYRRQLSRAYPGVSQAKIDQAAAAAARDEIETKYRKAELEFLPEVSLAKIRESKGRARAYDSRAERDEVESNYRRAQLGVLPDESAAMISEYESRASEADSRVRRGPMQDMIALIRANRPDGDSISRIMLTASTIDSRVMKAESEYLKQAIDRHGGAQKLAFMGAAEIEPVMKSIREEVEQRMVPLRRQADEQKLRLYGEPQIPGFGGGGQGPGLDPLGLGFR